MSQHRRQIETEVARVEVSESPVGLLLVLGKARLQKRRQVVSAMKIDAAEFEHSHRSRIVPEIRNHKIVPHIVELQFAEEIRPRAARPHPRKRRSRRETSEPRRRKLRFVGRKARQISVAPTLRKVAAPAVRRRRIVSGNAVAAVSPRLQLPKQLEPRLPVAALVFKTELLPVVKKGLRQRGGIFLLRVPPQFGRVPLVEKRAPMPVRVADALEKPLQVARRYVFRFRDKLRRPRGRRSLFDKTAHFLERPNRRIKFVTRILPKLHKERVRLRRNRHPRNRSRRSICQIFHFLNLP